MMRVSRGTTGSLLLTAIALALALAFSAWCISISMSVNTLRQQVESDVRVLMAIEHVREAMFELDEIAMMPPAEGPPAIDTWHAKMAEARQLMAVEEDRLSPVAHAERSAILSALDQVDAAGRQLVQAGRDGRELRMPYVQVHRRAHQQFTTSVNGIWAETARISQQMAGLWQSLKWLALVSIALVPVLAILLLLSRMNAARHRYAEDSLRDSEDRFRSVLAAIPDLILVLDQRGTYRHIYTSKPELLVRPREELIGQNIHTRLDSDLAETVQAVVDRAIETGLMQNLEYPISIDGKERWFSARVVPFAGHDDPCVLWVARDFTERRLAEQRLERSEERLRVMSENVDEIIVLAPVDFSHFEYVSPAYETIWGRSLESLHAEPLSWQQSIHPEDAERVTESFRQGLASGGAFDEEYRIIRGDGQVRWIRGRTIPIVDADGEVRRVAGVASDITKMKMAEQAVREREDSLRSIIGTASDAVIVADDRSIITLWNKASEEIFGYPADEAIGQPVSIIVPERLRGAHAEGLRRAAAGETQVRRAVEMTAVRKDGTEFPVELSMTTWETDRGRFFTGIVRDITRRRRNESALRESEQRFRSAFEETAVGMALCDVTGRFVRANAAMCNMLGWDEQSLRGKTFREITHPDDIAESERHVRELMSGHAKSFTIEKRYIRKDGTVLWALTSVAPVNDAEGHPVYLVGETQDISEQKRAEQALRDSEHRFRSIFEHAGAGMATVAPDGRFQQVNAEMCRFLGYSEQELLGMRFLDVTHPEDIERSSASIVEVATGRRQLVDLTKRYVRKDGAVVWGRVTAVWLLDKNNELTYCVALCQDITEQKRAEEALRRANEQLENRVRERTADLSAANDMLTQEVAERKRAERIQVSRNRVLERLSAGAPLEEVLTLVVRSLEDVHRGMRGSVLLVDEDGQHLRRGASPSLPEWFTEQSDGLEIAVGNGSSGTAAALGKRMIVDDVERHPYGERFSAEALRAGIRASCSEPIRSSDGDILGVLATYSPKPRVPDEPELELIRSAAQLAGIAIERRRSQERLRVTDRLASMGTLAAGLGHDMNNVLFPIRCRFDAIEWDAVPPSLRELLESCRDATDYLQQLSSGLRMIATDPDRPHDALQLTSLPAWWRQIEPLIGKMMAPGVAIEADLGDHPPLVSAAPHVLTQAVLNLAVNASESMPEGGRVRVWSKPARRRGFLTIGVSDEGSGMSEEVQRRALDPFFTTKSRGLSTGLGLSLVHGLVRQCGGSVEVDSAPGAGTTVRLQIPIANGNGSHRGNGRSDRAAVSLKDLRTSAWVANVLESAGYSVVVARDGDPRDSELWVTEPAERHLERAASWLAEDPCRRVVLLGPATDGWKKLGAVVEVQDAGNLEAIKSAVCEV